MDYQHDGLAVYDGTTDNFEGELMELLTIIATGLVWALAGMFLLLSAIIALAAVIYPFHVLFEGIKNKLL